MLRKLCANTLMFIINIIHSSKLETTQCPLKSRNLENYVALCTYIIWWSLNFSNIQISFKAKVFFKIARAA